MSEYAHKVVGTVEFSARRAICPQPDREMGFTLHRIVAEQSGQIDRGVVLRHRSEIHNSRDVSVGKQHVLTSQIANARLNVKRNCFPRLQCLDGSWHSRPHHVRRSSEKRIQTWR